MARNSSSSSPHLAPSLEDASCRMLFVEARTETLRMIDINEFFICKLCKGYLRDPYTSKECLHTFCYGCIRGHYLYNPISNACPTCKVSLGAKPWTQMIPDPAMKELSQKLLPDYAAKDEVEERKYYKKLGIKRKQPDSPLDNGEVCTTKISRTLGPSLGHMIKFELYPQRGPNIPLFLQLGELKSPCMETQSLFKVMYLRKYLAKKLKTLKPEEIEILCKGKAVGPEYSLEFIRRTCWDDSSKMILEYRRQLIAT